MNIEVKTAMPVRVEMGDLRSVMDNIEEIMEDLTCQRGG